MDSQIVLLSDAKLIKQRKKDEWAYFQMQLMMQLEHLRFAQAEVALSERIISMIQKELL